MKQLYSPTWVGHFIECTSYWSRRICGQIKYRSSLSDNTGLKIKYRSLLSDNTGLPEMWQICVWYTHYMPDQISTRHRLPPLAVFSLFIHHVLLSFNFFRRKIIAAFGTAFGHSFSIGYWRNSWLVNFDRWRQPKYVQTSDDFQQILWISISQWHQHIKNQLQRIQQPQKKWSNLNKAS